MFRRASLWFVMIGVCISGAFAQSPQERTRIGLVVDRLPVAGPTEGLEPQVLDFRYKPDRWQTCIGLVDDPHKTMVGNDGGLYYEYGKQGPEPYNCGEGSFGARVLVGIDGVGERSARTQSLLSPRVPIVITQQTYGSWSLQQEAWSNVLPAVESTEPIERGADRVDYLTVLASRADAAAQAARITLDVGVNARLVLDATRQRLLIDGREDQVYCQFSVPCEPLPEPAQEAGTAQLKIESNAVARPQKGWAQPQGECSSCFQHVLVGWGQPIVFQVPVSAAGKVQIALGLIEGYHADPGKRPLRLSVEGAPPREVDLVREYGKNVPAVLLFGAEDKDADGIVRVEIQPGAEAEDKNTILSSLWVFPADKTLEPQDVLLGKHDGEALARIDADNPPDMPHPMQLTWQTGELKPGETFQLFVLIPQGALARKQLSADTPAVERERCVAYWNEVDLPYDRFAIPDPAVQNLLDSCIRNLYQAREQKNDKPKFQVGPTCYRGAWAADGPFLLEAATYLGRVVEARAGLEQQVDGDDGPGGVEFSKKSGLRLWMVWRHAQLTGDRQWLEEMWPRVEREVNQIIEYRKATRDDPQQANFGLMPIGFGDGGLGGKHREYTNIYWTLAGLHAAIEMAAALGNPVGEKWHLEYDDYWQTFERARQRDKLVDSAGNTYVPVTMQGEKPQLPQCGAWAFLQSIFPGRIFRADDELMLGTMAMLDANQREGLIYGTGWIPDGIWNYAASFYGHAHLWLGHGPKAAATLYAFGNHASPLLCWREEQNVVGERSQFVGDMPHNWGSAEFIRLVRHLLILERGDELHLCEGLPRAWTQPGAQLRMVEVPTTFGDVGLVMKVSANGQSAQLIVNPPRRRPPAKMVVHLESFERPIASIKVDGKTFDPQAQTIAVQNLARIDIVFETSGK